MEFKTQYSPRERVFAAVGEGEVTKQSFKAECDVNNIVRRYRQSGMPLPSNPGAIYGDVSAVGSFQEALATVERGEEMFMSLPASVRKAFDNDPAAFLDALHDPDATDKLRELGLVEIPASEKASPVEDPAPKEADS